VKRGMTTIAAAFRTFIEDRGLEVEFNKPKIPRTKKPNVEKERVPLEQEEQTALLEMVRSEKPWKELYVLLAFHSGCSPKELVQTNSDDFDFDSNPPKIVIRGTKTKYRERAVPLVFDVERIKSLVQEGLFEEIRLLKPDNISNQITKLLKKIRPEAVGHSLRHTLRYNGKLKKIHPEIVCALGGWSPINFGMTKDGADYAWQGNKNEEFLVILKDELKEMLKHLEGSTHA